MSRERYREHLRPAVTAAFLVSAVLFPAALGLAGTSSQPDARMKRIEERQLLRTVASKYTAYQAGEPIGSETVTFNEFNDNSVEFHSESQLDYEHGSATEVESDMVLEEDTYFPLSFEMTKKLTRNAVEINLGTRYQWFSNVAVIYKSRNGVVDTNSVLLPTGAAPVDMSLAYQLYVPLYWYDTEIAGVQKFNVVDPWSARTHSATLRLQAKETIVVNGKDVETSRYVFTRENQNCEIYVDADGRIVKVDEEPLVFELTDWSQEVFRAE
jgi:hypothetical protein